MKYLPGFCYSYYMSWFQPQQDNTVPAINLLTVALKKSVKLLLNSYLFNIYLIFAHTRTMPWTERKHTPNISWTTFISSSLSFLWQRHLLPLSGLAILFLCPSFSLLFFINSSVWILQHQSTCLLSVEQTWAI